MNRKITLSQLSELIARQKGIEISEAENWVREYFSIIADSLSEGENVKVKGLGNFKLSGIEARESVDVSTGKRMVIPGHIRAGFVPEKSVAEIVNAPFASFETVELSDDISDSELDAVDIVDTETSSNINIDNEDNIDSATAIDIVSEKASPVLEQSDAIVFNDDNRILDNNDVNDSVSESKITNNDDSINIPSENNKYVDDVVASDVLEPIADSKAPINESCAQDIMEEYPDHKKSNNSFLKGFFVGLACIFAVLAGIWSWYRFAPKSFDNILGRPEQSEIKVISAKVIPAEAESNDTTCTKSVNKVDSTETFAKGSDVPTQPSDKEYVKSEPIYDTISKTRYLTTMARDHYGSYHLWPYIYKENSKILGHPDRIKPGTRVVIPPAEKYGINAKDKDCIARAQKMGVEIYAKYK